MNATHSHTNVSHPEPSHPKPPRWMETVVAVLLPPACREPVLGDLVERFGERSSGARYFGFLMDAVTTVPQVMRSQMRPRRLQACAWPGAKGDLRTRAEGFETQIWLRNASGLFAVMLVFGSFLINARGAWHFNETVSLAMTLGWIGAVWQSWMRGRSTSVPAMLSDHDLRAFYRRELTRQRDLSIRPYVYWFVPAALLSLYAMTAAVPGFRGANVMLLALLLQTCVITLATRKARQGFQRELDRLEHEVGELV